MNWGELIGWAVLALMVIAASRRYDNRITVEQEQAKAREIASHAPQWKQPALKEALDAHDYEDLDDMAAYDAIASARKQGESA